MNNDNTVGKDEEMALIEWDDVEETYIHIASGQCISLNGIIILVGFLMRAMILDCFIISW